MARKPAVVEPPTKYRIWAWLSAADDLDPGQAAFIMTGPRLRNEAEQKEMAAHLQDLLNIALKAVEERS